MSTTSMDKGYRIQRMAGRLCNGTEAGKGTRWHAVKPNQVAMCGASPGRKSAGRAPFDDYEGDAVTCPRCLSKLEVAS